MLDKREMIFNKFVEEWLDAVKQNRKPSTYEKYNNIVQCYFMPFLNGKKCSELENLSFEKIIRNKWSDTQPSESTLKIIRSLFIRLATFAGITLKTDMIDLPYDSVYKKDYAQNEVEIFSSKQQKCLVELLLKNTDRYKLGILLCLYTGIRVGELCALKTSDISLCEKKIYINSTVQRLRKGYDDSSCKTALVITTPKTPSSRREIPVCRLLYTLLKIFYK